MKKVFCLKYVSFDISFQSSVKQSRFYVKYQNNNKSFLAFHFSAWKLLADLLQEAGEWSRRERQDLIPLLFMDTTKLWIQCFSDLGTNSFQISFSDYCISYCNTDNTGQPTRRNHNWIIYWLPWWRQKCKQTNKQKSNLLISRKIWKKIYIALLYSGNALWYRWIVLNFQSLVKILSAKFSVTINGKTYHVTMEQIFKIYKDAFIIDTKCMYVTFISFIFKSETELRNWFYSQHF